MSKAQFKAAEDRAVNECVQTQERAGVDFVTDGEMRRNVFASKICGFCAWARPITVATLLATMSSLTGCIHYGAKPISRRQTCRPWKHDLSTIPS